jgi:hypothetical protein
MSAELWYYDVLGNFKEQHHNQLLMKEHLISDRTPIQVGQEADGTKIFKNFYILKKSHIKYALEAEALQELPIIVDATKQKRHYRDVLDIITRYRSARYKPVKHYTFRELIDTLCPFTHENNRDFTLWKIIALTTLIARCNCRVSSAPAFGKDSVLKVLGDLTGDTVVVANPTIAKLEYRLGYKVLMLNEFANLKTEDRYGLEHFLQAAGDLSNVFEKHSRASANTNEVYDISKLSLLLAYNNIDCYPSASRYFDNVFGEQTKQRFIPFKFDGIMVQKFATLPNAQEIAEENKELYKEIVRTLMWYRENWMHELSEKDYKTKNGEAFGLQTRWRQNFDTITHFIKLYAENEEEAQAMVGRLYNRHVSYIQMVGGNSTTVFTNIAAEEPEEFFAKEERIQL